MATDYATLSVLKEQLGITDTVRDVLLGNAVAAASRAIDKKTGRRFWLDEAAVTRTFTLRGRVVRDEDGDLLLVSDIGSLDGLVVEIGAAGSWSVVSGYEPMPDNALLDGQAITGLLQPVGTWGISAISRVRITARWGWPAVPDEIGQATLLQAGRLFDRRNSPGGVTGHNDWGFMRLPSLDPDVRALVDPYMLPGIA